MHAFGRVPRGEAARVVARVLVLATLTACAAQGPPAVAPGAAGPGALAADRPRASAAILGALHLPADDDRAIVHVLNRLGYGARPGDLARVRRMGLARYLAEQLHPAQIPDPLLDEKLRLLPTLGMDAPALAAAYPSPTPEDVRAEQARHARQPPPGPSAVGPAAPGSPPGMDPGRAARRPPNRPQQILAEMAAAKLLRAVYSERQLAEVLTDFWFNHFNVFAPKGADRWLVSSYERDAIRPHVLGRFRDLLEATATHPAMLFYLDNWLSSAPLPAGARPGARPTGLNENYARELLELHTLGVDGGYTQHDVTEVARCFTGWSIDRPQAGGGFVFRPRWHDRGAKIVLGTRIPAGGGREDGERVLDLLARHPATARHLATQLVQQLVADTPPPALVDKAAHVFLATEGDLRAVVHTIVTAPEFFAADAIRHKVKSPLELVASAARALGADVQTVSALPAWVARLGEPLYQALPPTGYPTAGAAWITAGTLLDRMNFGLALAGNHISGTWVDVEPLIGLGALAEPARLPDQLVASLLHAEPSVGTRAALQQVTQPAPGTPPMLAAQTTEAQARRLIALVLGSPEFQYH